MKGFIVVVYEEINDEEAMKNYAEKATLAIKKYSPNVLVRGGKSISLEGKPSPRTAVIEFPNVKEIRATIFLLCSLAHSSPLYLILVDGP